MSAMRDSGPRAAASDDDALDAYSRTVVAVAERVLPSVASLRHAAGSGSAVALTGDGLLVTSAHVIGRGRIGTAVFDNGAELPYELVGRDRLSDLAVVRVPESNLPAAELGDAGGIARRSARRRRREPPRLRRLGVGRRGVGTGTLAADGGRSPRPGGRGRHPDRRRTPPREQRGCARNQRRAGGGHQHRRSSAPGSGRASAWPCPSTARPWPSSGRSSPAGASTGRNWGCRVAAAPFRRASPTGWGAAAVSRSRASWPADPRRWRAFAPRTSSSPSTANLSRRSATCNAC